MTCPRVASFDFGAYVAAPQASEWAPFREHYPNCLDCSREVANLTILRSLLKVTGSEAQAQHPGDELLLAFHGESPSLSGDHRNEIQHHLQGCSECRDILTALGGFDFGAVADAEPLVTQEPGAARPSASTLRGWVAGLRDRVNFPPVGIPRPALAMAALVLLLVLSGGLRLWWGAQENTPAPMLQAPTQEVAVVQKPAPLVPDLEPNRVPNPPRPSKPPELRGEQPAIPPPFELDEQKPPSPQPSPATPQNPEVVLLAMASLGEPLYAAPDPLERLVRSITFRGVTEDLPSVDVLAPEHVAFTVEASPTLYWFAAADVDRDGDIGIIDDMSPNPLLEVRVAAPVRAGFHAISLAQHGVTLKPGVTYRWLVSLRSRDELGSPLGYSSGAIERIEPTAELRAELAEADGASRGHALSANGLWYDALSFFSHWIEQHPQDTRLRAQRAALLEQVGLAEAAEYDRRAF